LKRLAPCAEVLEQLLDEPIDLVGAAGGAKHVARARSCTVVRRHIHSANIPSRPTAVVPRAVDGAFDDRDLQAILRRQIGEDDPNCPRPTIARTTWLARVMRNPG